MQRIERAIWRWTRAAAVTPAKISHGVICTIWISAARFLGATLNSIHNIAYYLELMRQARGALAEDQYDAWALSVYAGWSEAPPPLEFDLEVPQ